MCVHIIVGHGPDGIGCDNHGELVAALGGLPVYHAEIDTWDLTDEDCLCGILPDATARKFGYRVAPELSTYSDVVLARDLH